jgi:glutaredoxin
MKRIYIFTCPKCKGCNNLKRILVNQSIPFIDVNTSAPENKKLWDDIKYQTNSEAIPMVFIQNNDEFEGQAYIPDKDWKTIDDIVEIIKNNI